VGCIQPPEPLFSHGQQLPDQGRCVLDSLEPLRRCGPHTDRGERAFHDVRRSQVLPVALGEAEKRNHPVPVIFQRLHGLRVPGPIAFAEGISDLEGLGQGRGIGDDSEKLLGLDVLSLRQPVQDVARGGGILNES
jgi:hypothetical protein